MTPTPSRPSRSRFNILAIVGALACTALLGAAPSAPTAKTAVADWPSWRGPNRDAISRETGLLDRWPEGGPPLAWTATGLGEGYAAVSVAGGRIFTMGEDKQSSYVHSLNEADGKIVWSSKVGKPSAPGGYAGPRCTPTVDGDRVYALGQSGDLVCLNAADGKEVWRTHLEKDFKGKMMSGWGYSESPLVDGDKVIATPGGKDGTVVALDKMTGKQIWRSEDFTDSAAYSSVIAADIAGKRTYIQLTGDSVAGLDATNGEVLWKAGRKGKTAVIPTPVYADNHVFVTSGYKVGGDLFKITPPAGGSGKFSVEQVYHTNDMEVHIGGVVLVDGHLYGVSGGGFLSCIDFLTGKQKWKDRSIGKGAVVYAEKLLYVRADAQPGDVALVEANPEKYVERGQFEQPDGSGKNTWPPPVIAGGRMYLRDQDALLCYDISKK